VKRPHFWVTKDHTPRRMVLAHKDVSIGLFLGKTGCGKSTMLGFLGSQALGHKGARVIHIETGNAGIGACMAHEGAVYRMGEPGRTVALQPLADCGSEIGRARANEWLRMRCELAGLRPTGEQLEAMDAIVQSLGKVRAERRTMTEFVSKLPVHDNSGELRPVFAPLAAGGEYAYLFDGNTDIDLSARWINIQLESVLDRPKDIAVPAIMHVLGRVERSFGQEPTYVYFDEAWKAFSDEVLARWILARCRTARARQGRFLFATQEVGSFVGNMQLLVALASACSYEIFGWDAGLAKPEIREIYRRACSLSEKELDLICTGLRPKDESTSFYFRRPRSVCAIPLELGPAALAVTALSEQADLDFLAELEVSRPKEEWLEAMLEHRGCEAALKELHAWKSEETQAA
jgi:type IV secretory pathway VirB4 component